MHDRKAEVDLDHNELPCAKTLGVWWLALEDVFTFKENVPDGNTVFTEGNFLKKIATLFDSLGLLAPYTIRAKMLLQEMWTAGLEWDDELPEPLIHAARAWFGELSDLKQLQIPRRLGEKEELLTPCHSIRRCIAGCLWSYCVRQVHIQGRFCFE